MLFRSGPEVRRRLHLEMLVVLGISLGQSAVYALLSLINKLTQEVALNRQTTSINASKTPDRPWLDLAYQVANLVFPLVPVALVLYLLWVYQRPHGGPLRSMGFDLRRPGFDLGVGSAVFVGIEAGGLVLYYASRELGYNTSVSPANLTAAWWTVPMLLSFFSGMTVLPWLAGLVVSALAIRLILTGRKVLAGQIGRAHV